MTKNTKRVLIVVGAVTVMLVTGVVVLRTVANRPFNARPFEREVWLSHRGSDKPDNPRGGMAASLKKTLLNGRPTRVEVVTLLGEPELKNEPKLLSYNLGMWSGFRVDYDSLEIEFGSDGRVSNVYWVQH